MPSFREPRTSRRAAPCACADPNERAAERIIVSSIGDTRVAPCQRIASAETDRDDTSSLSMIVFDDPNPDLDSDLDDVCCWGFLASIAYLESLEDGPATRKRSQVGSRKGRDGNDIARKHLSRYRENRREKSKEGAITSDSRYRA